MKSSHLKALLTKNILISKSTIFLSILELFSPIIIIICLLGLKSLFKTENLELEKDLNYLFSNCSFIDNIHSQLKCYDNEVVAFVGEKFPLKLIEQFNNKNPYIEYKIYKDFNSLTNYIISKDYGINNNKEICFAVSFKKEDNKYIYKLHFFASPYNNEYYRQEIPSTYLGVGNRLNKQPDFVSFEKYSYTDFFMTQKLFYDYVLQEETGNQNSEINMIICPKKYDKYIKDPFANNLGILLGFFSLIAYALPLTINIYRVVKEKETKSKEGMKIMGLTELIYFLSNFIIYFVKNLFYAGFITLVLSFALKKFGKLYIFVVYFLYGLVIFSLIFFFQSFLERTRIAIIVSLLIYSLMYFFFIVVRQYSVNIVIKYIFCILFPPTTLQLGINTISTFETNFQDFNDRINYKHNKFSILNMLIFFIINFIFYMFLGFFLENILPHEYGIKKPINFIFTPQFWGCEKNENNLVIDHNINKNKEDEKFKGNNRFQVETKNKEKNKKENIDNINQVKIGGDNILKSSEDLIPNHQIIHDIKLNSRSSKHSGDIAYKNSELNFESEQLYEMNYTKPKDTLKIKNITKIFEDNKKALNNVSFNLYKNEIFALLGHNGAGKSTLLSILSGLYPTTAGEAIYNNQNILTPKGHDNFRKYLGICPQHDVLFDDLTVQEHLKMFCLFKSISKEKIDEEIYKILEDFNLLNKRYTKARDLSGGQKRKLSICIALAGGSSVIFLDEPTSGMDITSRRNLWDILKRYTGGRIIILTTHYMEEAAVLGDRIGILSEGEMKCIGSPLFLIARFGKNINLNITKELDADNDKIINFVFENITDIEYEIYTEEILFQIPKTNSKFCAKTFFKLLDDNYKNLKIKNYSLSMSTLEDVFINVSKLTKTKKKQVYDINQNNLDDEEKIEKEKREKNNLILYDDNNYNEQYFYCSKIILHFKVSIKKRLIQIYRDKKTFFLEILCPILLAFIGCIVCYLKILEKNQNITFNISQITTENQTIYYYPALENKSEIISILNYSKEDHLNIEFKEIDMIYNDSKIYLSIDFMNKIFNIEKKEIKNNYGNYIFNNIDKVNHHYEIIFFSDILLSQTPPIYLDFMMKNIIRYATNNKNLKIEVINEPLPYTYMEKKKSNERNNSILLIFISICFTLIPANFVTIIIKEKENNSKHLQIISGISLLSYWINNFFFELFKYYIIGGICISFLVAFGFYEDYIVLLYALYGPSMIAFTYILGTIFKKEGVGQTVIILINLLIGALGGTAVFIMRMYKELVKYAIPMAYAFRIIPSFCFCYGYNILLNRYYVFATDYEIENDLSWEYSYWIVEREMSDDDVLKSKYLGSDLIYLGVESIVYILILAFIENFEKIFFKCFTNNIKPINLIKFQKEKEENPHNSANIKINIDNNIIKQAIKVNINSSDISLPDNVDDTYVKNEIIKAKNKNDTKKYAIKIIDLYKNFYGGPFGFKIFSSCFGITRAVRDISLCLEYGECFGFLGVNGAGKTTTFRCLSKEILPTYGKIYIDNKEINKDFDKVRSLIGYCPQFDAIFESLTVYENLEFYGLIKGAKKDKIKLIVSALMDEMSLMPFKDKISGKLSGGNKRKLSVAIALICNPPIILLDEPSTGMDPEARRYMWGVIHRISINRKKSTIIMTTHSMEEAETLCKRIGILVDGQFKCLATSDEIKEKYGYGFEINLRIKNPNFDELFNRYKILNEDKEANIDLTNLPSFLDKYNLNNFRNELTKEGLGGKIVEEIEVCGYIYLSRIISWIYFLENALKMIRVILVDFPEIYCIDYGENNFVFKIKRNRNEGEKSIGYLFSVIEENSEQFNIEQYFLQLTSLEQIFNKFAKETERYENQNLFARNIDIPINNELISFLFN